MILWFYCQATQQGACLGARAPPCCPTPVPGSCHSFFFVRLRHPHTSIARHSKGTFSLFPTVMGWSSSVVRHPPGCSLTLVLQHDRGENKVKKFVALKTATTNITGKTCTRHCQSVKMMSWMCVIFRQNVNCRREQVLHKIKVHWCLHLLVISTTYWHLHLLGASCPAPSWQYKCHLGSSTTCFCSLCTPEVHCLHPSYQ